MYSDPRQSVRYRAGGVPLHELWFRATISSSFAVYDWAKNSGINWMPDAEFGADESSVTLDQLLPKSQVN